MPTQMTTLEWAVLYIALNLLVLLVLAVMTVRARVQHKVIMGDGNNPQMTRAMRAHANASEYIPAGSVGLLALALLPLADGGQIGTQTVLVHVAGAGLLAGRVLHGIGLSAGDRNLGRMLGTMLTWAAFIVLIGGLIWAVLAR